MKAGQPSAWEGCSVTGSEGVVDRKRTRNLLPVVAAAVMVVVAGIIIGACGSRKATAIRVEAADSGSQIRVHVGQPVSLNLGPRGRGPWALSYPRKLMSLTRAARDKGEFRLVGRRVGQGRIVAWPLGGCGFPALRGPARKCPMTQVGDRSARPFTVTVQIAK
jgi:hypothetical protein